MLVDALFKVGQSARKNVKGRTSLPIIFILLLFEMTTSDVSWLCSNIIVLHILFRPFTTPTVILNRLNLE